MSLREDVSRSVRRLNSLVERLPIWAASVSAQLNDAGVPNTAGPIFVVHGRDLGRASEVSRIIDNATDREAIILHEQPNQGRTILEKFEANAAGATFAVVVLTADDEGRLQGSENELRPRGRQNVILELGYFFGKLGRSRVAVLVDAGVEHPSDVAGLVYIDLDGSGAWKYRLVAEFAAAGIEADLAKVK